MLHLGGVGQLIVKSIALLTSAWCYLFFVFQFYQYITLLVVAILLLYVVLAIYNVLWLSLSRLGKLSTVMRRYRTYLRKTEQTLVTDQNMLGNLWDIYYNNKDLKLLLNLLAESSGLATSLR